LSCVTFEVKMRHYIRIPTKKKNNFVEMSNFVENHKNNYVENSSMISNVTKNFDSRNQFAKFLDTLVKLLSVHLILSFVK